MSERKNTKNKYKLDFGYLVDYSHESPMITDIKERYQHTYIVGKTGMGKSSLLERMAMYDIDYGVATIFIDPKGDSVKKLYHLTKDKSKVHYISIESPIIINPLNKDGYRLDNLIQEFIQILDVLVTLTASNPESTVLMREIITMAMRAITEDHEKNLDYFTRFLLYPDVRKQLIQKLSFGSDVHKYWSEFDSKSKDKVESAKRVASRLIEISTGEMRDFVIGKNEFDISNIVQEGKVVLVDTSHMNRSSRIYLTNLIVYSVLSYCEFAKLKDKPLLVYVDEFQIVVSSLFTDLLARSRSSNVGFTLAHQTFHQIPRNILSDIFGTVNTQICFRCGDEEATRFAPIFGAKRQEIFNLPKYQAWLRIGIDNILIETFPPKLTEVPDIEINSITNNSKQTVDKIEGRTMPESKDVQSEISSPEHEYNFLEDCLIHY
jgi:type IV secretory pathway VirB4 component